MGYEISVLRIVHDTIVDGIGFRTSVYCAGCPHHCKECHNPESWDLNNGTYMSVESVYEQIVSNKLSNVTFTGGDPMFQASAFFELAKAIKQKTNKNIWCYTGWLFEDVVKEGGDKLELLKQVDILVDGRYECELRDYNLSFRGSSNQRIIDVQKSLTDGRIVLWGG